MTRKRRRALYLILFPIWTGAATAGMAPLFGNDPAIMFPVGLALGLIAGAVWCAVAEG